MTNIEQHSWLCRHCNNLIDNDLKLCPHCGAERPEDITEPTPKGINEVVQRDNYTNATPRPKAKYIFREAVLVNAGDIILVLGLFCTFGTLISPLIIDFELPSPMLWTICGAILIFATTLISWAIMRSIAEISRQLREREERNNKE